MPEPDHPPPSRGQPLARAAARTAPRRRVLLGFTIMLVLLLLAAGIFMLDDIIARLAGRDRLVAVLPGGAELSRGSPVWIGGRAVGQVEQVEFLPLGDDSTARIAVTLAFPDDLRPQLRRDAHVRIASARLIGPRAVDIRPGSPDQPPLGRTDTLRTRPGPSAADLMRQLDTLRTDAAELVRLAGSLREPAARRARAIDRLAERLTRAGATFDAIAADFEQGPLGRTFRDGRLAALVASIDSTFAAIAPAFDSAAARLQDPDARAAFRSLRDRADALATEVARLRAAVDRSGGGMLTRIAADSALAMALHAVRAQLDTLIMEVKANPLRFAF